MKYKLLRGLVIDQVWQEPGAIISAHGRYAELLVRSGAAEPVAEGVPAAPPIETATAPAPEASEKAVGPRHAGGKR
jgi:hypothetical protein